MHQVSTAQTPLLELKGVKKSFDLQHEIGPLDLTIPNGQFLTILGPSGCGKTTLLRMLAGLDYVDSGAIYLSGTDITQVPAEQRPINTIFQRYALFPHMSVFENVAFGLRMQKQPESDIQPRVMEALQWVQLAAFAPRAPSSLSGGQQQRVAIARAVVNRPRVLLLDEPLSALDYNLRRRMQNELKALQRQLGITFIFVTHDQEEALSIADRIIVMREGVIEQDGQPREIYEEPRNLFVAKFIGDSNIFDASVLSVLGPDRVRVSIEGRMCDIVVKTYLKHHPGRTTTSLVGARLKVLLRPEDLRITEINHGNEAVDGIVGYVRERNYKGMTLDSLIELVSGKFVLSSEFFNEDDPDVDHSLHQKVAVTWVESWEVVLDDEVAPI